jgi:acyl-CoA thioester hydrolase
MLTGFPITLTLPVLWGDQDAFGHVNNTACIRWFESARVKYLEAIEEGDGAAARLPPGIGPILANVTCNYRRQINYPDTVVIGAKITKIGNTSFTMAHAVWSEAQQAIVADGDSIVVTFDYSAQRPIRVPDALRAAIAKLEQKDL